MSPVQRCEVPWTSTAIEMLESVSDRHIRQQIFGTSKRLETDPEKQGKPLRENLLGFRSLRAVGQRYRLVYSIHPNSGLVYVVAAGLHREGSRDDVYELAQRMVRLGLAPGSTRLPSSGRRRKMDSSSSKLRVASNRDNRDLLEMPGRRRREHQREWRQGAAATCRTLRMSPWKRSGPPSNRRDPGARSRVPSGFRTASARLPESPRTAPA